MLRRVNPNAAGIDLGARIHYVALPPNRAQETVRHFECYTDDLEEMATWLKAHGIETVAMESTGVYWVPVFQVLERAGLDVQLVNARHYKAVPGRKTDVQDCQWLQHLHECGLLRGSFRPVDAICVVRSYVRQHGNLVSEAAQHVQRMQKALEQMNVQLHKVVSDITGETGLAIIDAIIAGERDPAALAQHRNYRCRRSPNELARALRGDWREEHLFCLEQEVELYRYIQGQIARCEQKMLQCWRDLEAATDEPQPPPPKNRKDDTDVRLAMFRAAGADLTQIPGLASRSLQTILAEVGLDMSRWPTEKHFTSWVGTCPKNNLTGGKRRPARKSPGKHRVANAFRVAAQTLANSKTALGAYYRRMRARKGGTFANASTANKLAKLFYRALKHGMAYVERGAAYYEQKYRAQIAKAALKRLRGLGVDVQVTDPTACI